jgi:anoctamin-10
LCFLSRTFYYHSETNPHRSPQFGDSVAFYFSFLSSYTQALIFPAILGLTFHLFGSPYSPIYSTLLFLWSVVFVEWWRVRERILSVRFGSRGSFRVEKHRAQYIPGFPWWRRDLRMVASFPIILMFAGVLAALLTGIFVFEAFVTQLYTGPGHKYIVRLFVLTHINFNPTSKRSHSALQSSLSPLYLVS